jgi:hypothetical protein
LFSRWHFCWARWALNGPKRRFPARADNGEQAVQYVALCRSGAGAARDNVLIDYVALRASAADYQAEAHHCDPLPPPPPPPADEAFIQQGMCAAGLGIGYQLSMGPARARRRRFLRFPSTMYRSSAEGRFAAGFLRARPVPLSLPQVLLRE